MLPEPAVTDIQERNLVLKPLRAAAITGRPPTRSESSATRSGSASRNASSAPLPAFWYAERQRSSTPDRRPGSTTTPPGTCSASAARKQASVCVARWAPVETASSYSPRRRAPIASAARTPSAVRTSPSASVCRRTSISLPTWPTLTAGVPVCIRASRYDRDDARDGALRLWAPDRRRTRGDARRHRAAGAHRARLVAHEGHALVLKDLDEVLEERPERLLVGTGAYGRMRPDRGALETLRARGIEVEVLRPLTHSSAIPNSTRGRP